MTVGRVAKPAVPAAIRAAGHVQTYGEVRKRLDHVGHLREMRGRGEKNKSTDVNVGGLHHHSGDKVEAPSRLELENKAFAELCLTTWLWRRLER